jgi:hypothetical protein
MILRSDQLLDSSVLRLPAQFAIEVVAVAFGRYLEKAVPMQSHLRMASFASESNVAYQTKAPQSEQCIQALELV